MAGLLVGAGALSPAATAHAQPAQHVVEPPGNSLDGPTEPEPLGWREEWRRVHWAEAAAAAAAAAGTLAISLAWREPTVGRWEGASALDSRSRDGLRADRGSARRRAGLASDLLLWTLVSYPLLDAAAVSLGKRGRWDTGWQLAVIDAQAYAFTQLIGAIVKRATARARPFVDSCGGSKPHFSCDADDRNQSFYSGHTAMAFTAAGLACAQHGAIPLYGDRGRDVAACATTVAAAAAVGTLRVVADEHYLTDVAIGAGVGLLVGYLWPTLLHFRATRKHREEREERGGMVGTIFPIASPRAVGLAFVRPL